MRQLITFIRKEFLHVFRDRKTLLMLFGLPIAQIVLFGFALSNEIKNSRIAITDYSKDAVTEQLISKIASSNYFDIQRTVQSATQLEAAFKKGDIRMAIIFPADFANDLVHTGKATIQVIADASDPNLATTITNYITRLVGDFNTQTALTAGRPLQILPEMQFLYNPELRGAPNFVPGVMALVLMLVCTMMTSVAIVKEKELGTMEILLVSPFKPIYIIISKLTPNLLISVVNLFIILMLSAVFLDLHVKGSILLLTFDSILFILTSLSIGLLLSINAKTQQAAMMGSMMGMMLPTMLLTGFLFPIENMPLPLQVLSNLVPSRWYFIIVKKVMLKGLGITAVWKETLILTGMCLFLFTISLRRFKIRL
ncbi:ABC transporter permease [Flavitalea sp. BT771]|uniref:ABC transporter permease n=1 Tax=Flavitalea sp. BT771 TaxID=3063329 RepID=UPI0026E37161|nr:ABC transporter permease [Flavitalea sp. BT771]MDO6429920.1 ABC transporter permease [Flavitalea sp. BT771]MDV6217952.1 ABC transporter permease [Flavitalea sp. BT771]